MEPKDLLLQLAELLESNASEVTIKSNAVEDALSQLTAITEKLQKAGETEELIAELEEVSSSLLAKAEELKTTRRMTVEAFSSYVTEQLEKAAADESPEARLTHLKANIDEVLKFEYKSGELPQVSVYVDPGQHAVEEEVKAAPVPQPAEAQYYATKAEGEEPATEEATAGVAEEPAPEAEPEAPKAVISTKHDKDGWALDMNSDTSVAPDWGTDNQ